jgi:hypothetical protein
MDIKEIMGKLSAPIPAELMKQKRLGRETIDFISWYDTCNLLDARVGLGNWSWEITEVITSNNSKMVKDEVIADNRLVVVGRLTIYGDDRTLSMGATGTEVLNCSSYGDPSSNAEAMAFKRACAKLGLARYLYDKEMREIVKAGQQPMTTTTITRITTIPDRWTADCGLSLNEWKTAKQAEVKRK